MTSAGEKYGIQVKSPPGLLAFRTRCQVFYGYCVQPTDIRGNLKVEFAAWYPFLLWLRGKPNGVSIGLDISGSSLLVCD